MTDAPQPQKPSAHGRALGTELARLAESQVAAHPMIPERCKTCAFREGTQPNQMAGTLSEALECVLMGAAEPFYCHQKLKDGEPTQLCVGYVLCCAAPFEDVKAAIGRAHVALKALEADESA